ncbi:MAG: zf-HC2 domain-containing protein [Herpetosiphon sp.]|nr:zf-HC2 domain-containing protein [Herpetosiphon sp.]
MSDPYDPTTRRLPKNAPICALVQDLLPLYLEKETSDASYSMINDHIAQCEHCAGFLSGVRSVRQQFQQTPIAPPHRATSTHVQPINGSWLQMLIIGIVAGLGAFSGSFALDVYGAEQLVAFGVSMTALLTLDWLGRSSGAWSMAHRILLIFLYGTLAFATRGMLFVPDVARIFFAFLALAMIWIMWKLIYSGLLTTPNQQQARQTTQPRQTLRFHLSQNTTLVLIVGMIVFGGIVTIWLLSNVMLPVPLLLIMLGIGVLFGNEIVKRFKTTG